VSIAIVAGSVGGWYARRIGMARAG